MSDINPMLEQLQKKSNNLLKKDLRRSPLEILGIFQIYDIYTDSAYLMILRGQRFPNNSIVYEFLNNVFDIVTLYTTDHSYLEDDPNLLNNKLAETSKRSGRNVTKGDLSYWLYRSTTNVRRSFTVFSKTTCSIADILDMNLVPNMHISTITNQYIYYRQLLYLIMRALAYDGINTLTQEELAKRTKIDVEDIKHPENLCRNKDLFFESLNKISAVIVPYHSKITDTKKRKL